MNKTLKTIAWICLALGLLGTASGCRNAGFRQKAGCCKADSR